jgi:hypothetical protein
VGGRKCEGNGTGLMGERATIGGVSRAVWRQTRIAEGRHDVALSQHSRFRSEYTASIMFELARHVIPLYLWE